MPNLHPDRIGKQLDTPNAREYAELIVIRDCLKAADRALNLYFRRLETESVNDDETEIRTALFRHGLISLMSCFSVKGELHRFKPVDVFGGIANWEIVYYWLHDYRDAFAAHNFGPARQAETTAFINPQTGALISWGPFSMTFQGPGIEDEQSIKEVFVVTWAYFERRLASVSALVDAEVMRMSLDELNALPECRIFTPGINELRMSRAKFRSRKRDHPPIQEGQSG